MTEYDLPRLAYLGVILLIMGGWVFARYRGRLATALQQAILWVFLFAGLVVLYGFKDDLRRQMIPSQAVQVDGGRIALERANDQHFYASIKVNGQDVVFLVDTGATDVVLSRRDAERVGIDLTKLRYLGIANTANGPVKTARVQLDEVDFAGYEDRRIRASVNDGDMEISLLGMSYLSRFTSIEITGDTLYLRR
jgi:aspartyl protease family protein